MQIGSMTIGDEEHLRWPDEGQSSKLLPSIVVSHLPPGTRRVEVGIVHATHNIDRPGDEGEDGVHPGTVFSAVAVVPEGTTQVTIDPNKADPLVTIVKEYRPLPGAGSQRLHELSVSALLRDTEKGPSNYPRGESQILVRAYITVYFP